MREACICAERICAQNKDGSLYFPHRSPYPQFGSPGISFTNKIIKCKDSVSEGFAFQGLQVKPNNILPDTAWNSEKPNYQYLLLKGPFMTFVHECSYVLCLYTNIFKTCIYSCPCVYVSVWVGVCRRGCQVSSYVTLWLFL